MIAEFGLAALWLAAALAALQLLAGSLGLTRGGAAMGSIVRPVAVVQGLLALTAFAALITMKDARLSITNPKRLHGG
jgi:cytochrome c-type biogenesis protein CcmF